MNNVIANMGKSNSVLLYRSSRDGLNSLTFWTKCQSHEETIALIKTDLGNVIGFYWPEKWEDTTNIKSHFDLIGWKFVVSGKPLPFLFYFLDGKIEIIKHREN